MRNDPHDDFDDVPHLSAKDDDDDFVPTSGARERTTVRSRSTPVVRVKRANTGPIWALVGALFIAFVGLAWWSFQQISLMEQQLVATQESFARISEDAAGRLQDISGKVVANQSAASNSEALKLQIQQLESKLTDQDKQQEDVSGQQNELDNRLLQMSSETKQLQAANTQLQDQVKSLASDLSALQAAQADSKASQAAQAQLDTQLKAVNADIAALKKQGNPSVAIDRLEQELIVMKSEQDNRPAAAPQSGGSTAEFDAFRGQVTRNVNTLQSQIQNLQQQINAKR